MNHSINLVQDNTTRGYKKMLAIKKGDLIKLRLSHDGVNFFDTEMSVKRFKELCEENLNTEGEYK